VTPAPNASGRTTGPTTAGPAAHVAVVTGGGRGLGRGISLALADAGFDVVIGFGERPDAAGATAAEITASGRRAEVVGGDVAEPATSARLLDAALGLGLLGSWVNNAGISILAPLADTPAAALQRMLEVNVMGVLHGLQAAARWFVAAGVPGRIVNIASDLGLQAFPYLGGYAATKFAVVGLTKTAALELGPTGVTVNAVCPGTAETDMVIAERASQVGLTGTSPDDVRASYLADIPAGRFCTPDDVGGAVAWLCGPFASYVTGQAICVNGGSVLH
jgi:NAD(P)-dependent dehydrogenase (short-subunit alcohol dehydrogenase family)